MSKLATAAAVALLAVACARPGEDGRENTLDAILLVTLDTTRSDRLGFEGAPVATPTLDRLAASGVRFEHAYTTAPMTLPAHASILTGLLPPEHGIHENSRRLRGDVPLLQEQLRDAGWTTAAFVSGLPLARQFGLARGFGHYDDELAAGATERRADATSDRAIEWLRSLERERDRVFLWVHYFDPHEPYDPPEPFRSEHPDDPYLGEIAFMDRELGRLVEVFEERFAPAERRIVVAGDHGEGLGDHGESLHGNLVYDSVMRVPLLLAGAGLEPEVVESPISTRRLFDTVLTWAELAPPGDDDEVVVAEGMKPYLQYGWQPQVMAVLGSMKAIRAGGLELYDLAADPAETRDLSGSLPLDPRLEAALGGYPIPAAGGGASELAAEDRTGLAALGYVSWDGEAVLQEDAPSPAEMTHLFDDLDRGSGLFVRGAYAQAIPVFERIAAEDPGNLMVIVRLAVASSLVGRLEEADRLFERAADLRPGSLDVRHYRALHLLRAGRWRDAEPLFEEVLAEMPDRLPALAALAGIRERQGLLEEALRLYERIASLEARPAAALARIGTLRMARGETAAAIRAFERARGLDPEGFGHQLELGVLYLAERRLDDAAAALDAVSPSHPEQPMALFKRAQVAVLRAEPDAEERVRRSWLAADAITAPLIRSEKLFRGIPLDREPR
ncbi:MAG TPA: sulfatase-like hydrolase/transferase [Thermoanaerobaculia bacterium]|nr:sulfatase-like hydrolase/transferase [Thermoanaerobaculia bacterium]